MPAKKQPTTRSTESSTSENVSLPEQEEFRQHLRRLAVSAVQVLLEQVMREELEQCIGARLRGMHADAPRLPQWVVHARFGHRDWTHRRPESSPRSRRSFSDPGIRALPTLRARGRSLP